MIVKMIFELGLKQVVHNALKRIKPIMATYTMRDGVEVERNEYYNSDQMKQMFLEGWKCSCNWISVTDEPPKEGGEYLVSDGTASTVDIWLCGIGWRDPDNNERVTHWMPMPLAPTKKEGEK